MVWDVWCDRVRGVKGIVNIFKNAGGLKLQRPEQSVAVLAQSVNAIGRQR